MHDDEIIKGNEGVEQPDVEMSEVAASGTEEVREEIGLPGQIFCSNCGQAVSEEQQFCPNCGEKINVSQEKVYCVKCGVAVEPTQNYCPNCGNKMPAPEKTNKITQIMKKVKSKMTRKKLIAGGIGLAAVVAVICVALVVIPKIFVPISEYLAKADYNTAYEKAKEEEKESVLVENLIATLAAQAEDSLNDSSSFNLKKAWYDKSSNYVVMSVSGTNKMGGTVTNYICYSVFEGEYSLVDSISDTESQQINKYDDTSDMVDKIAHNLAVVIAKKATTTENELDKELVKRINDLHENGVLQDVTLLEETKSLYSSDTEKSDSEDSASET